MKKTSVQKRNSEFKAMTPSQKRVAIAKDVIKHLRSEKINTTFDHRKIYAGNGYLAIPIEEAPRKNDVGRQWQSVLRGVETCSVCAKGAVFVATMLRFNNCKVDRPLAGEDRNGQIGSSEMTRHLRGYFSKQQLDLIESAYEACAVNDTRAEDDAVAFGQQFASTLADRSDRLIAIMQNIIKNNGTFKP